MAKYRYEAKSITGKTERGTLEVSNETALKQAISEKGMFLISAKEIGKNRKTKKFTAKQIAEFCKEVCNLLEAGVTLVRALDIVMEEEDNTPYQKVVYNDILADLRRGVSFSDAMENRNCFPPLMLGMIRSGEGNGNLDVVMGRLAIHYEKDDRLSQQVKSAMTYPMVLLVLMIGVVALIITFIMPQFEDMFAGMETLPLPTVILYGLSDIIKGWWYMVIIVGILLFSVCRIFFRWYPIKRAIDYLKVHAPVVGNLNKIIYTARFARTLSSLYSSGMPLATAIGTAAETVNNLYILEQFEQVTFKVRSGVPLSGALKDVDGFLTKLSSTIFVGEESGRLDTMLNSIAESMEEEASQATARLVTLMEPMMIAVMALLIGFIIIAIIAPIYGSYGTISEGANAG